jgi:hypothetical protein
MATLFGFGDSFTGGHFQDVHFKPYQQWKEFRGGNLPPVWIDLLGQKLNMDVVNYGHGGNSNLETFETICKNSDQFKNGDTYEFWSNNSNNINIFSIYYKRQKSF